MPSILNPYLNFRGNAREVLEFYRSVFGGDLAITTFSDLQAAEDPAQADLVMHGMLTAPNGIVLMAADAPMGVTHREPQGFGLSLSGDDEAELTGYWERLTEGGRVTEPLATAPWGDRFGMCTDRYGIEWMVNISGSAPA